MSPPNTKQKPNYKNKYINEQGKKYLRTAEKKKKTQKASLWINTKLKKDIRVSNMHFYWRILNLLKRKIIITRELFRIKQKVGTGVSARGTFNASIVPHRKPCSMSQPWILTLTFHASSFWRLDTFWVPQKDWSQKKES